MSQISVIMPPWPGWKTVSVLGRGGFGAVYLIERDHFGTVEQAAMKVITIPQNDADIQELYSDGYTAESVSKRYADHMKDIVHEYSVMAKLKGCANVVYCDDVYQQQHEDGIGWDIFIRMELLTPLTKAMLSEYDEAKTIRLGADIARALMVCKEQNIIHRDIKPQNIFVSADGTYKLGDFGVAKVTERTTSGTKIGTYKYMAPEVYHDEPYGTAADVYSLGMVLYWMMNERRAPFVPLPPEIPTHAQEEEAKARRFSGEALPEPKNGSAELKALVQRCCNFDPEQRPSVQKIVAEIKRQQMRMILKNTESDVPNPDIEPPTFAASYEEEECPSVIPTEMLAASEKRDEPTIPPEQIPSCEAHKDPTILPSEWTIPSGSLDNAPTEVPEQTRREQEATPRAEEQPVITDDKTLAADVHAAASEEQPVDQMGKQSETPQKVEKPTAPKKPKKTTSWIVAAIAVLVVGIAVFFAVTRHTGETGKSSAEAATTSGVEAGTSSSLHLKQTGVSIAAAGFHTIGLKSDGTVVVAGEGGGLDLGLDEIRSWKNIVAVASNTYTTAGLKADGTVVAAGGIYHEQSEVSKWNDIVAIDVGDAQIVGLRSDGSVVAAASESFSDACDVSDWKNIVAISAGDFDTFGLKLDGTVVTTDDSLSDEVADWNDIIAIDTIGLSSVAGLKSDGTVVVAGYAIDQSQVSDWKDIVAIAGGDYHLVGLKSDGTVVAVIAESEADRSKTYNNDQCHVEGWKNIVAIAAGGDTTVALASDGTVVGVGRDWDGQLDFSDWSNIKLP